LRAVTLTMSHFHFLDQTFAETKDCRDQTAQVDITLIWCRLAIDYLQLTTILTGVNFTVMLPDIEVFYWEITNNNSSSFVVSRQSDIRPNEIRICCTLLWADTIYLPNYKRVLNFVRRNIYHCTPEVKALSYTLLIRPHLEYASAALDPYTARDSHKLDKIGLQRCAARFCQKRLQANHISFRTYLSDRMAVTRTHEKLLFYKGLTGSFLRPRASSYKMHPIQLNR